MVFVSYRSSSLFHSAPSSNAKAAFIEITPFDFVSNKFIDDVYEFINLIFISFFLFLLPNPKQNQMEASNIRWFGIICRSRQLCGVSTCMCISIRSIGRFTVRQSIVDVRCTWYATTATTRFISGLSGHAEFCGQCSRTLLSTSATKQYEWSVAVQFIWKSSRRIITASRAYGSSKFHAIESND